MSHLEDLSELDLDLHSDLDVFEIAVDQLGRQLHTVIQFHNRHSIGSLVHELLRRYPDDRICLLYTSDAADE